jgi:hypothetical protein
MLNLNYNINPSKGPGNCRGEVKFNYSASIVVAGGGGGGTGGDGNGVGGGGGGGMAVTQSISIIPNVTYQINVGAGGAVSANGQDSYLIGFDDNDTIPISFLAGGGKTGAAPVAGINNGGDSGTGSLVRGGVVTQYAKFNGGTGSYSPSGGFGPAIAGGGGASNQANGANGTTASTQARGGNGASGITAGGGGGATAGGPTPPPDSVNGVPGTASAGAGVGGNGSGVNPSRGASAGTDGTVIISYAGQPKAFVTNASTTTVDGVTTHTFASGSGTFIYTYPYPWPDVVPYTVEVCPDEHNEDVRPEIYWDYSYITNLNRFPAVPPFVSSSYATMSINAQNTNCINVVSTNNNSFTTNAQTTVIPCLTGSNWPKSGSVTMSLSVAGITYDPLAVNQFYSASLSSSANVYNSNPSITGSIISSSFLASEFYRFYVNANVIHNYGYSIPRNGLIQQLDASNPASYPGSGSVWYDVSGYNHNMSASFGATFPSYSNNQFSFNGINNAVSTFITSSLPAFSMVVWQELGAYTLTSNTSSRSGGAYSIATGSTGQFDSLTYNESRVESWEIATEQNNRDVLSSVSETSASLSEYVMISMTNTGVTGSGSQKLYRNTDLVATGSLGDSYTTNKNLVLVGSRYYSFPSVSPPLEGFYAPEGFYTGSIVAALLYNRVLSQSEIIDIWNAGASGN